MSFLHPVRPTTPEFADACRALPPCCRNHVYIFLIHGMDPLDYANLHGLCNYLHQLGFTKTYYGQLYHTVYFRKELLRVHEADPEAHFVLIGFSFGANMVRNLAQTAREQNIPIDLLVYLGGNTLHNTPRDHPDNAQRLINVLAHGYIWNGTQFDNAENISVEDVLHFGSPTHPRTLEALARNLVDVGSSVPIIEPVELPVKPGTEEPTPRPVSVLPKKGSDQWDFLQPVSQLRSDDGVDWSTEAEKAGKSAAHVADGPTLTKIVGKN
jgi:hypothetical protein